MSLPDNLNIDRIVDAVLEDMTFVARAWNSGRPKDETALLNHITGRLNRSRKKCDVGVNSPMTMESECYELHRQGKNQTDRYGSDFAVTVEIPTDGFKKTALFQLKKGSDYKATLTREQLEDGCLLTNIEERNFVLFVDEDRLGYRVQAVRECLDEVGTENASKQFDTSQWEFLAVWLVKWFCCQVGKPTNADDKDPVEPLLESYRIPEPPSEKMLKDFNRENIPDNFVATKSWLQYTFKPKEPKK
jgi:hypothetical protein